MATTLNARKIKEEEEEDELTFAPTLAEELGKSQVVEDELTFAPTLAEEVAKPKKKMVAATRAAVKVQPQDELTFAPTLAEELSQPTTASTSTNLEAAVPAAKKKSSFFSSTPLPEIVKDKTKVADIRNFLSVRYPNMPVSKDDTEAVQSFADTLAKGDIDIVNDLTFNLNATDEQKIVIQKAVNIGSEMPIQWMSEIGAAINPLRSPSILVGGLVGFGVRKMALEGMKRALTITGATVATESTLSATQDLLQQKGDIALGKGKTEESTQQLKSLGAEQDFSYSQLAISAAIGGALGAVEGGLLVKTAKDVKTQTAKMLADKKKTPAELNEATKEFLVRFEAREKEIYREPLFESPDARQAVRSETLDEIDEPTSVTSASLNTQTIKGMYDTVREIFKNDPTLLPAVDDSRSIAQIVIDTLEKSGTDDVQQAAKLAGVDEKAFLNAFKVTMSEAGTVLQNSSSMARTIGKMVSGQDPELDAAMRRISEGGQGQEYFTGSVLSGARKITDASVGLAVTSLSTTILNTVGLVGAVSFNTLVDITDAASSRLGRMMGDMKGGAAVNKLRTAETPDSLMKDSFYSIGAILDSGFSNKMFESVMQYNPRLNNMLIQNSIDVDGATMNKTVNFLNGANRAVEMFIRRPMMVSNVRRRMKENGLDFEDFVANNKPIPPALLEQSVNDTLSLTFSSGFRRNTENSLEGRFENAASQLVSVVNSNNLFKVPMNIIMPFYRFGLNSLRYSYRMTPSSAVGGMLEFSRAAKLRKQADELAAAGKGKEAQNALYEASGIAYEGRRKVIEGSIGSGIIVGAMVDRENNADLPFYRTRNSKGEVSDISNLAPISFVYAMAEVSLIMKDMAKSLYYTLAMSPEERAAEAKEYYTAAEKETVPGEKQALLNAGELLELGRVRDFDGSRFMEILAGWGRQGGTQQTVLDSLKDMVEEGITEGPTARKAGAFVGDFASRFDNFMNPFYDLYNLMSEDYRQVDSRAPTRLANDFGLNEFADAAIAAAGSQTPGVRDLLQSKDSLFQEETPQYASFTRYLTGQKPAEPTDAIQNELLRLNIEPYKVYRRSGDRVYDNLRVKAAGPFLRESLAELMSDPEYQDKPKNAQLADMKARITEAFADTKEEALFAYEDMGEAGPVILAYRNMPKDKRQAADDMFVRQEGRQPVTLEDMRAITAGDYGSVISKFASGGLARQTRKAFGR